jgi:hypothetical protein
MTQNTDELAGKLPVEKFARDSVHRQLVWDFFPGFTNCIFVDSANLTCATGETNAPIECCFVRNPNLPG